MTWLSCTTCNTWAPNGAHAFFLYPHMHHMHESIYKRRDVKRRRVRLSLVKQIKKKNSLSNWWCNLFSKSKVKSLISISLSIFLKSFLAKACANVESFRFRTPAVPPRDPCLVTRSSRQRFGRNETRMHISDVDTAAWTFRTCASCALCARLGNSGHTAWCVPVRTDARLGSLWLLRIELNFP